METFGVNLMPVVGLSATAGRTNEPASAAREFDAMLIETVLRHGGLLKPIEGGEGSGQSILSEWLTPLLARQLAEQVQLGLGEMMIKSISEVKGEAQT